MDDQSVMSSAWRHNLANEESPRGAIFLSSFMDFGNTAIARSSRPWPFAHLADALSGIYPVKQNMLIQNANFEKDTFRKSVESKNYSSAIESTSESRQVMEEQRSAKEVCGSDIKRLMPHNWNNSGVTSFNGNDSKRGFDKQVAQELVKGVHVLSEMTPGQCMQDEVLLESRSLRAVEHILDAKPVMPDGLSYPKLGTSQKQVNGFGFPDEEVWEYEFIVEAVPTLPLFSPGSSHKPCLSGSCCPSKISLRKIPSQSSGVRIHTTQRTVNLNSTRSAKDYKKVREAKPRSKQHEQMVHILKQLICGGFSGVISRTAVAPLDLIKTYLITSHGARGSKKSALAICKEIVDQGGWRGLFRGNLVNCIRVAPSKAIELCVFETVRRALIREDHPLKNMAATIAGGAAGMAGTFATYPLELIRTRLSVQPEMYFSLSQAIQKIAKEEGFLAFYSGLSPSLVGVFPYAATNYFVYDGLRTAYCRSTAQQTVPTFHTLLFGAVAAAASSAVTYPIEVARRQMQLSFSGAVAKKSTMGVILDIYQHEGFLALYRGLGTTWLKLIPAAGISFVCYEAARLALHIDDASLVKPEETIVADQDPP